MNFFKFHKKEKSKISSSPFSLVENIINRPHQTDHYAHVPPKLEANIDASKLDANDVIALTSSSLLLPISGSSGTSTVEHGESSKEEQSRISKTVTFGQKDAFDNVSNFLKETKVGMVGIYGMGGIGKTTLMKKVCDEFLEPANFKVILIVVSKTVNLESIQKSIMRELKLDFNEDENLLSRGMKINKALYNRSSIASPIALLLDDIWETIDQLEELGVAGGLGLDTSMFKIIFTTRSEDVCLGMRPDKTIRINPLGWDDSWALFNRVVGENILCSNHRIEGLAREVADECGGLPLALRVVGKAMVSKSSVGAWQDALNNLRNRPSLVSKSERDLFERLKFSYDNLENEVERDCFLFCCMYPEDYKIEVDQLIECWIGEGIFDAFYYDTYEETFNRGWSIVDTLLAKSMLEKDDDDHVKIHDVIRDMGIWIGSKKDLFFRTQSGIVGRWAFSIDGLKMESYYHNCRCWSVLDVRNGSLMKLMSSVTFMPVLKVLIAYSMFKAYDTIEPIENLTELRHLEIHYSGLEELPPSIKNLTKLRVIKLRQNSSLHTLPETIGDLCDLRKLSIKDCGLTAIPGALEKLKNLETVDIHKVKGVVSLGMFNGLTNLRKLHLWVTLMRWEMLRLNKLEELVIHVTGNDHRYDLVLMKDIIELPSLRHLGITRWPIADGDDMVHTLKTMPKLHFLSIKHTPLSHFMISSGERAPFSCLDSLLLRHCRYLKYIVGHQHLQQLRILVIEGLHKVEECLLPDLRGDCMPNLQSLAVYDMKKMKRICDDDVIFPLLSYQGISLAFRVFM